MYRLISNYDQLEQRLANAWAAVDENILTTT
jgi:hypothetical protein